MSDERFTLSCPASDPVLNDRVVLAHGEGGRLLRRLIRDELLPRLGNERLNLLGDAAVVPLGDSPVAMTTDSFVVSPLFFPGGDIGSLAVYGTINDLAVAGARPRWISLAIILEEGLPVATLQRVLDSVAHAAQRTHVQIVTGDTKVVPRGAADGLFLTTTGVGEIVAPCPPGPLALAPGDALLVSGPLGRHGMAVLTCREGIEFEQPILSDSGSLIEVVAALRESGVAVRAMRDATRGGLAAVLHEWAEASGRTMLIEEPQLPITPEVRGACELLGLDAVHVACEGVLVAAVPGEAASVAVTALREVDTARGAAVIGCVQQRGLAPVVVRRAVGQLIPLDEPLGAPLPRIC